ncbi:response regulator transcription factor [Clostridium sp. WLY-B-L2]|uniref:Stage 0 sporulation protein A homolog n=1 Tax=Clostridium aromativorans TaxID=2836848 RepID=A0ABS8NBQ3_9CLOT|nr:response regulator transcription factor [Clostridium aromativorans]MCC9296148.1 response regulator transcription factor [Clostridium aromativorans]
MTKILIVEDEVPISNLIKLNLTLANYECKQCYDGQEALNILKNESFDLILLDVMLPKIDGFTLYKKIKPLGLPAIFLTARTSVGDRVSGLKMGADDYIIKPFEGVELIARIENVLRHYNKNYKILKCRNLEINLEERTVKENGKLIDLTLKEFELLAFLMQNKNKVLTRERLIEKVWGYDYIGETRTIDNHIQKLRKKLAMRDSIKTVFGLGYRMEE